MEMRFFWVTEQVKNKTMDVQWHPGLENLADYYTKHFDAGHHKTARPWYLQEPTSVRELPRAAAPKALRGCVGIQAGGYSGKSPLPRLVRAIAASAWYQRMVGSLADA